jgi:hypothetical protein
MLGYLRTQLGWLLEYCEKYKIPLAYIIEKASTSSRLDKSLTEIHQRSRNNQIKQSKMKQNLILSA